MNEYHIKLSLTEICNELQLKEQSFVELVEYGIVNPKGNEPTDWTFDLEMVSMVRRAMRLHRDLEIEWSEVAIIMELVDERDRLLQENLLLKQRLKRFLAD